MPDGSIAKFHVWESSIMEPGLEAKFPEMKTFAGQGIDDPYATIRFDYNPYTGFHGQILSGKTGRIYIDPYAKGDLKHYISYNVKDYSRDVKFICEVVDNAIASKGQGSQLAAAACLGTNLRTYRLALACTGEYAVAVAGATPTVAAVAAAMLTSMNRVNGVYEKEVSLRMTLIANNNNLIYLNGATDPYTNNNGATMLGENQANIDAVIGTANYDIGHVFSTGGGGIASLNSPCVAGSKARGVTGLPNPIGDAFDIDYVAHEMGHQWGGNHSMAGCGASPAGTKFEVGSGNTIQAYAGICGAENIQPNSDAFFHAISFDEISNFITTGSGNTCGVSTATGNGLPVINALPNNNLSIPPSTPFTLSGTASDPNNDPLTYCWEQWDTQGTQTWNAGATAAAGNTVPLFKSRLPITNGVRTFPDIAVILAGYPANPPAALGGLKGETLSPVARAINFRLTVRDNRAGGGGVASSGGGGCQTATPFVVNVVGTTPFAVTLPNGGESYTGGSTQTITWNNAGTSAAPYNVANVRISLSTDGGLTYPTTILASTANDGTEAVTIPSVTTTTARVRVEALGNVFFDISNANFNITGGTTAPIVTINQAAAQADPTSTSPINFTVVFDQAVTGFTTGDVTLTGTAGATLGTVTGSGATYNVAVSGMTGSGTVIATIAAGVCQNASAQTNNASTSTDNTVTYNLAAAVCTTFVGSVGPANTPTNLRGNRDATVATCGVPGACAAGIAGALHYVQHTWTNPVNAVQCVTVTYSNPTTNFGFVTAHLGSVDITNLCTNFLGDPGASAPAGGAPIVWSFNALALVTVVFHVGNVTRGQTADSNIQVSAPICVGATAPSVTINQAAAQPDPTGASPINFTAVFSEPVTGFANGDVTLSGSAGASVQNITGGPATYNIAVSGMTGSGTVISTIAANVATGTINVAGNTASTSADNTVTYNAPPGCTSVNPVPNDTLCAGSTKAAVVFTSGTPGTIFNWTNSTPSIGLAASGTGNLPSFVATNATAAPVVATIIVTPSLNVVTPTTTTFNFTGGAQTFTVPAGVTSINLTTLGAAGGNGAVGGNAASGGAGGRGSRATGTLAVTPGQVLTIFVGGTGTAPTAGFNGGGTGGNANAGGGGGASDVRFPGASSADRILVAGGGGGGGRAGCEANTVAGGTGGNGDGNGVNGSDAPTVGGFAGGGLGAIGTTPGGAGIGCSGFLGAPGLANAGPAGGNGGAGETCCCFNFASVPGGGGGGGGFLGGAGGGGGSAGTVACTGNDKGAGGGGAGGTSFTGGVTAGAITTNIQTGNGQVVLNYNVASVCTGPTTSFTITVNPTPTVNVVPNQTVCAGSPTTAVTFTGTPAIATFNWTNNNTAIGLAAAGTGNIPSFITTNTTNAAITGTITVTPQTSTGSASPGGPVTFTNPANIAIPASGTGSGAGSASNPYPSNITVSGLPTTGVSVQSIRLTNIQHTWSDDIGVLLVGPGGQKFVPMARVGGTSGFDAVATITISDAGATQMPTVTAAIPTGTYRPTAGTAGAIWPAPAPIAPYNYPAPNGTATFTNTFNTTSNYNGTWSLYVTDMAGGDIGNIAGGWGITLVTPAVPGLVCTGTPRTFTITVNPNPAIIIVADPGTTICEGDPTLLTVVTGTATPSGVLYNQTGAQINGSPSQVFEPANTAFNSQSADDFTVPAGATWGVTQITANGINSSTGASTSVNVFFYANSGGNLPGAVVASFTNVLTFTRVGGNYTVTLPSTVNLTGGTYWMSFQVNMSFATGGQWFWGNFGAANIGNEYAFQNPGGGFATPCTNWGYGGTGCNVGGGPANRNLIFSVTGTSVVGGGPLGGGYTFLWSPAAGLSSTTSNPVAASPMNTTTYTVVATTAGGCTRTASVLITVNKRPTVTTQPVANVRCVGTTATFTVGATGTGLIYQWQESLTGCPGTTWTNLTNGGVYAGVNTATLTVGPVTALLTGRGYRCIVTGVCAPIGVANISNCALLTVNPLPVVAITPPISCGGVAGISGTQLSVGSAPPPVPGTVTVNSGTINLTVPDNTANGVSNVIAMTGVPANATITNVAVTFNNFSHTYPGDMIIHLRAPNGNILNLYKYGTGVFTGPASGVPTWGWYGARVSQLGSTAWSTVATAPFIYNNSTAWRADAINTPVGGGPVIQNPTGFVSAATSFTDLYTTPASTTGNWTLAMCDGGPGDVGTLASWGITIEYTTPGTGGANNSFVWSPLAGLFNNSTATIPYTGTNTPVVFAAPTVLTTYTVTATDNATGCTNTATALVNYTPPAPSVTPSSVTMCLGDPAVRLVSSSSTTTNLPQVCSGPISVIVPDNNPAGATSNLTVSGVPAGCNVSAMSVTFNMAHTWAGDVAISLRAPNGNILNLDYYLSNTGGTGATTGFVNTRISSAGTAALSSGANPYTGTFRADASLAAAPPTGPTGFLANVNNWNALYSVPNGTWTLAMVDAFGGDQGTLTSWCIDMTYVCGVPSTPATWSPIAGLFNDAAASIAYTGDARDTVWTRPTPAGVYPYQVTVQSLPVPSSFVNPANIVINQAGPGTPYPANLTVSGLPTSGITVQNVILTGISHTWGNDIDILLQSPAGKNVILMSDIGGTVAVPNATYTFVDGAPALNANAANPTGTYRPTNFDVITDNWPAPGPGVINQPTPTLATFVGTDNVNGVWKLFVFDDIGGDAGNIAGGFRINFNVSIPACTSPARTVVVTVNSPTSVTTQPVNQTICTDKVATFTVVAAGSGPFTYQWQVSTNGNNPPWTNITNGGVYSGATTATLTITAPPVSLSGNFYRVIINGAAPCAAATSFGARLTVNPLPTVVITAAPYTSLFPGLVTTLSSTVSPFAAATYTWLRNGAVVSGATTGTLSVNVDGLGDYQLRVTDVNGCTNSSNIITIKDSASGNCFIYPNPTSGVFQVRYYSVANNVLPRGLVVYDAKGDRVLSQTYTIGRPYDRMDVDMRAKGKGMYWVEIVDRNGNRLTMCRVVIQ